MKRRKKYRPGQDVWIIRVSIPRFVCKARYVSKGPNPGQHHALLVYDDHPMLTHEDWLFLCREDALNRLRALKEFER